MKTANRIIPFVLALAFLASGAAKLAGLEFEVVAFERWGYPLRFMYFVGLVEVTGALLLLLRRTSALAGAGLAAFMTGAVGTHVIHAEWGMLVVATVIMLLSARHAWLGLGKRESTQHLPGTLGFE